MEYCFSISNVNFQYSKDNLILKNINLNIESGKFTTILGRNGCGKSTLIKLLLSLLPLTEGNIHFYGKDIKQPEGLNSLRQHCGIVFQNPDNQFVAPVVADDIRFGLNNHKIPESEQSSIINEVLTNVNLQGYENRTISSLSGGQKQRIAIAGIMAMKNDVLIFDEATSMLDPEGKLEVLNCINNLRYKNRTILLITQNTEDSINSDRIILFGDHEIIASGRPDEILTDPELLKKAGVQIPFPVKVYYDLEKNGIKLDKCPLSIDSLAEELCKLN
ncbi:MAG: ATP-binding cassette domain-containing protein [Anaerolineaceae bacterium]|nr:ATP-binding cassette domain-containing protein [Anaerolineaceae bacterium]